MKLNEMEIRKICKRNNVIYHHHDEHEVDENYLFGDRYKTKKPIAIIYSSQYSSWKIAILEDMSIVKPYDNFRNRINQLEIKLAEYEFKNN